MVAWTGDRRKDTDCKGYEEYIGGDKNDWYINYGLVSSLYYVYICNIL